MKKKYFIPGLIAGALVLAATLFSCSNLIEELRGHPVTPEPETPATYTVTVATGITHGTVSADKTSSQKGETVTLTISANSGYEFDSISVKDANNNDIAVSAITTGTTYTFVMSESNVTVSVSFKELPRYAVTVVDGITNGTVTADRTSARKDETVTLTVAANSGYELDTLTVRDADNNVVSTTEVTAGTTYKFAMPEGNVTVSAAFEDMLAMVDVITSATTITGQDPSFVDSGAGYSYKGAFRTGRNVTLSPYSMGKYEVTQELYKMIMEGEKVGESALTAEPSYCKETGTYPLVSGEVQSKRPVEGVTWYDAVYFCNTLTEKTLGADKKVYTITNPSVDSNGHITSATVTQVMTKTGYRLPTEAEWEFAARGGDQTKPDWNYLFSGHATADGVFYSNSKNSGMDSVGWYLYNTKNGGVTGDSTPASGTQGYGTHEIGKKEHNRLGIYDMSGNVWEWCYDWSSRSVGTGNVTDPVGDSSGSSRVSRGGSWYGDAVNSSVTIRNSHGPYYRSFNLGFRVVRSAN